MAVKDLLLLICQVLTFFVAGIGVCGKQALDLFRVSLICLADLQR
ncbi:hypothetical protein [Collimonas sp.]|jgi:hypothetical protein|nr:hypothetical protein [Collimonas sp.]HWX02812.1 hypothetical protein [Collimonas sp.]